MTHRLLNQYDSVWAELGNDDERLEIEVFYMLDQDIETRAIFPVVVGTAVVLPAWGRVVCHLDPSYDEVLDLAISVDYAAKHFYE